MLHESLKARSPFSKFIASGPTINHTQVKSKQWKHLKSTDILADKWFLGIVKLRPFEVRSKSSEFRSPPQKYWLLRDLNNQIQLALELK